MVDWAVAVSEHGIRTAVACSSEPTEPRPCVPPIETTKESLTQRHLLTPFLLNTNRQADLVGVSKALSGAPIPSSMLAPP